jgi:hypothetical protein
MMKPYLRVLSISCLTSGKVYNAGNGEKPPGFERTKPSIVLDIRMPGIVGSVARIKSNILKPK